MSELLTVQRELPARAAERLRDMIVSRELRPGDRIPSESDLVQMFGVSRSTIREAVKILVAENVVAIQRGRGTFVCKRPGISNDPLGLHFSDQKKLLHNLLETRLMLEPQVAALAAERATEANIRALEAIIHQMESSVDSQERSDLDIKFHSTIAKSTQNDVLHRFIPIIIESIREGYHETNSTEEIKHRALLFHQSIFNAIKNRDPDNARLETEQHIYHAVTDTNVNLGGKDG